MESKTYKLIQALAYLMFFTGGVVTLYGIFGVNYDIGIYITLGGLFGGLINGVVFLFFAKLLEQNEDKYRQQASLFAMVNRIDDKIEKIITK